mgnify:FL=1
MKQGDEKMAYNAKQLASMAWIARNSKTKECYASCNADPVYGRDALKQIAQWHLDGATVELVTKALARKAMSEPPAEKQVLTRC